MYPMHLIDSEAYMDDFAQFTLADALDMYVTDHEDDPGEGYNPLDDTNFADPDELRDEWGPFSEDEDFSDMDCSD